jgi:hypothetical protein
VCTEKISNESFFLDKSYDDIRDYTSLVDILFKSEYNNSILDTDGGNIYMNNDLSGDMVRNNI